MNLFKKKKKEWFIVARTGEGCYDYEETFEFNTEDDMLNALKSIKNKIKEGHLERIYEGEIINWAMFAKIIYGKI